MKEQKNWKIVQRGFLKDFNKQEKKSEQKEDEIGEEELNSQVRFREFIEKVKTKLEEDYQRIKLSKSVDSNLKKNKDNQDNMKKFRNFALQEDLKKEISRMREKIFLLQQKNNELVEENQKVKHLMKIRQETFMKREKRLHSKILDLLRKLQNTSSVFRETSQKEKQPKRKYEKMLELMKDNKEKIKIGIEEIQSKTNAIIIKKEKQFQNQIEEMENQYRSKIQEERKERYVKKQDIIEKTRLFKQLFDEFKQKAEDLDARNIDLTEENIKLKISFESQKGSEEKWTKTNLKYKKRNKILKKELEKLKKQFTKKSEQLKKMQEELDHLRSQITSMEKGKVKEAFTGKNQFEKLKKELKNEKKMFFSLKQAYINILSSKNELEVFLRQCINDVKMMKLSLKTCNGNHDKTLLNSKDREKVLQLMLSKEKVLSVLLGTIVQNKKIQK